MPRGFFEDPDFSKVFPTLKDEVLKITDNDKKFEISVDTHGYKPEELQVKVLDDVVTVEAKHEEKKSEENNKSFVSRQFSRYISFPSISYYFHIPKIFLILFPHTGKNRNRRKMIYVRGSGRG